MKIRDIYEKYHISPNLAVHMLRVTKVALFIADHWTGPPLNRAFLTKLCMLHDMGNIVKFDFDKYPQFLGKEIERVDHWKKVQKEMIQKYGKQEHEVTAVILEELGVDKRMIEITKESWNPVMSQNAKKAPWEQKIFIYSDGRVGPGGVITLQERLEDLRTRYPEYKDTHHNVIFINGCKSLEEQIQENMNISVSEISDKSIERNDDLLGTEI